mmetsp:Transcript_21756/g.42796  ORF Transcript_21756/g.42796 Transcript_21756/m.42796 type:complete len:777 (+) Transcript_21756:107-2437(+)
MSSEFYVEAVSTVLADGHRAPSLVVTHGQERVLVNVPEGCQRMCGENRMRISNMDNILLTRLHSDATLGIGGMLLTLAGVSSMRLENMDAADTTFLMNVYGPTGLGKLVHAHHHVYKRNKSCITVHEVANPASEVELKSGLKVRPVAIRRHPLATCEDETKEDTKEPEMKRRKVEEEATEENDNADVDGQARAEDEAKTTENKPFAVPYKFGKFKVCSTRQGHEAEVDEDIAHVDQEDVCCSYILSAPAKRGKFLPAKAIELGVPKGPSFGRLTKGEAITLADGRVIKPEDCMAQAEPEQHILIVECPDESFIPALKMEPAFEAFYALPGSRFVIHFASSEVFSTKDYQLWMQKFTAPNIEHILFSERVDPQNGPVFRSSAYIQSELQSKVDEDCFNIDYSSFEPEVINNGGSPLDEIPAELVQKCKIGVVGSACVIHPESRRGYGESFTARPTAYPVKVPVDPLVLNPQVQLPKNENDWNLTFLGTGSAIPSKYRNVSSILLRTNSGSMLWDAGEGTCAQLARLLGQKGAHQLVESDLKCVYITHMHADHHLGLLNVLSWRARAKSPKLLVVGPSDLADFLEKSLYALKGPMPEYEFIALDHKLGGTPSGHEIDISYILPSVNTLTSVLVYHCYDAYGVVVNLSSGTKLVYSGDTQPCDRLVMVGKGAHMLIHEATFEDEKVDQARAKRHSTLSEAISIGKRMGVDYTVLTHFSQRYPKIPPLVTQADETDSVDTKIPKVAVASDLMTLSPATLDKACSLGSAVQAIIESLDANN